jgi:hypothetical protein
MSADAGSQGSAVRGRLRIYLGYAPGAGTTCALLSEGRWRAGHGTDVVVASAETHGRPHTEDLLAGLEVIPSAKVPYRGTPAEEMDLGAVLARSPAAAAADSTCTSSPAHPTANSVPATAACEPHLRKRPVMTQQNAPWPGRMRQAARWGPRRAA